MPRAMAVVLTIVVSAAPAAAQAIWDARELAGGGTEFRLGDGRGAAILLACQRGGVSAGFEFSGVVEAAESASIRGVPGERRNVAVAPVDDRMVRLTSAVGLQVLLRLLRSTANLYVRAGGQRASFEVFGSAPVVSECLERQDAAF